VEELFGSKVLVATLGLVSHGLLHISADGKGRGECEEEMVVMLVDRILGSLAPCDALHRGVAVP
jgi:hypothetical protein